MTGGAAEQLTRPRSARRRGGPGGPTQALVVTADEHQRDERCSERADLWIVDPCREIDAADRRRAPPRGARLLAGRAHARWSAASGAQRRDRAAQTARRAHRPLSRSGATGGALEEPDRRPGTYPRGAVPGARRARVLLFGGIGGDAHLFRAAGGGGGADGGGGDPRRAAASPASASSAGSDAMAYVGRGQPPTRGGVRGARLDGYDEAAAERVQRGLLREVESAAGGAQRFTSSDGTQVEGWVILPRVYDPARSYPLILGIHGGPHGAYGNDSRSSSSWGRARLQGLYTNPRGSTGYGEKFLWATWGGWGDLDYEDVMAGVDYAMERYAIDEKRLGVSGYSYGGFLTNWIMHATRFTAAI